MSFVMDERVVPSIRRRRQFGWKHFSISNDWWRNGGLEAHQGPCIMIFVVLPISPYTGIPRYRRKKGRSPRRARDDRRNRHCEPRFWQGI